MTSAPYVALGDSYAAGVGADQEKGTCFRSAGSYPLLVAARLGLALEQRACIGATVADVLDLQLDALGAETRLVTISVGGNDIGFTKVLSSCAAPAWLADGLAAIAAADAVIRDVLPARLGELYRRVRQAAPRAQIVATGYPRLFGARDCNLLTFFSAQEITRLNGAADRLAATMSAAAAEQGVAFIDPRGAFEQHPLCSTSPWVHNLELIVERSFHPTPSGHRAYADLIEPATGLPTAPAAAPSPAVVQGPVGSRGHDVLAVPVITAPRSLAAAATVGLDPHLVRRLGREHHRGVTAASQELHEIEREVHDRLHPG